MNNQTPTILSVISEIPDIMIAKKRGYLEFVKCGIMKNGIFHPKAAFEKNWQKKHLTDEEINSHLNALGMRPDRNDNNEGITTIDIDGTGEGEVKKASRQYFFEIFRDQFKDESIIVKTPNDGYHFIFLTKGFIEEKHPFISEMKYPKTFDIGEL